jgi:hypothetical protein
VEVSGPAIRLTNCPPRWRKTSSSRSMRVSARCLRDGWERDLLPFIYDWLHNS